MESKITHFRPAEVKEAFGSSTKFLAAFGALLGLSSLDPHSVPNLHPWTPVFLEKAAMSGSSLCSVLLKERALQEGKDSQGCRPVPEHFLSMGRPWVSL